MRLRGRSNGWLVAAACMLATVGGCREPSPARRAEPERLGIADLLGGETGDFAIADGSRRIRFPRDHGPHPDFRSEWWYVTGNLDTASGRPLGFQVTFFRTGLAPGEPERASDWATHQVWMAHMAVTDPEAGRFRSFERFARGALGLAGARAAPFRVWLEDWELATTPETRRPAMAEPGVAVVGGDPGQAAVGDGPGAGELRGTDLFPLRLRATAEDVGLDLTLTAIRPAVLQGQEGLSRKGERPENASYYYSFTRMAAAGTVRVAGEEHAVEGTAWMDREWSTSALEEGQVGWDWFALHLSDGTDLMLYLMRRADGALDPHSSGTLIGPDGGIDRLRADAFDVRVLDTWRSPESGAVYPSGWRLLVPGRSVDLVVEPLLRDQELDLAFRYWEGAVTVRGRGPEGDVEGRGYVELTGYGRDGV